MAKDSCINEKTLKRKLIERGKVSLEWRGKKDLGSFQFIWKVFKLGFYPPVEFSYCLKNKKKK